MKPVKPTKISDQIAQQIEQEIIAGIYPEAAKLPSERVLAEQFAVSRPSIRDAIKKLEAKGLVTRKQGGGTFVNSQLDNDAFGKPLFDLLASNPESHYDLLEFRCALESVTAYYAALRGSESDLANVERVYQEVIQYQDTDDLDLISKAVVNFYLAIADASHNALFVHLLRGISDLLIHNVKENLLVFRGHRKIQDQLNEHRKQLMLAIINGEAEAARVASGKHLAFIEQSLLELDRENNRMQGSVKRLLSRQ